MKLFCPKCNELKDEEAFKGKGPLPTRYCDACREYARNAMRLHHNRRKLGIAAPIGRPVSKAYGTPTRLTITIPIDIQREVEEWVANRVKKYLTEHNMPLPKGNQEYGSTLAPPRAAPRPGGKQAPATSRTSNDGPITEDHHAYLEACRPTKQAAMKKATRQLFDMDYNAWVRAERPDNWGGYRTWQKENPSPPKE
jgi:hypothetical protein